MTTAALSRNSAMQQDSADAIQFDLRSLFLLTFLCAVAIAVELQFRLVGTVLLFVTGFLTTMVMRACCEIGTRRFWFQGIWGVLLPLACIFTDPFVFVETGSFDDDDYPVILNAFAVGCYAFMACEMMLLCASWFWTPKSATWAAFLSGSLLAGSVFAGIVAICLVPLTLFASLAIVGLPGWTPWFTMVAYGHGFRRSWRVASRSSSQPSIFGTAGIGFVVPIAVGLIAYLNRP